MFYRNTTEADSVRISHVYVHKNQAFAVATDELTQL